LINLTQLFFIFAYTHLSDSSNSLLQLNISRYIWISVGLLLLAYGMMQWPVLSPVDEQVSDIWVRHNARAQQADPQIMIIEIDDTSIRGLEQDLGRWPWPRSVYGYLIEGLTQYNVKAFVFDILFTEKDIFRPDGDAYFAEVVGKTSNVYLASIWHTERRQNDPEHAMMLADLPSTMFAHKGNENVRAELDLPWIIPANDWKTGLINYNADSDGIGRYYQVWQDIDGWRMPSLSARLVSDILGQSVDQMPEAIRLNFASHQLISYQSLSFKDAYTLANQSYNDELAELLKDKIILIGATATGLYDLRHTPISDRHPGINILATAIDNLKDNQYYRVLPSFFAQIYSLAIIFVLLYAAHQPKGYQHFIKFSLILVVSGSLLIIIGAYLFSQYLMLLPFGKSLLVVWVALVASNFFKGIVEYRQRRHATQMFSRFLDPKVVNALVDNQNWQLQVQARSCPITVLFSDIRGFTTLSESRSPEEVMGLLNDYFALQVATIFEHGGTLDKFIGDAIMAFWGAPLDDTNQADNALNAALAMKRNLDNFRTTLPESLQAFDIGIGIHSGNAVVGVLGSEQRFDYTAIGDTVNLASRIEGLTKEHGRILLSQETYNNCKLHFEVEAIGNFKVKGRQAEVSLYRLTRAKDES
jgi:adenylate cyclase